MQWAPFAHNTWLDDYEDQSSKKRLTDILIYHKSNREGDEASYPKKLKLQRAYIGA